MQSNHTLFRVLPAQPVRGGINCARRLVTKPLTRMAVCGFLLANLTFATNVNGLGMT